MLCFEARLWSSLLLYEGTACLPIGSSISQRDISGVASAVPCEWRNGRPFLSVQKGPKWVEEGKRFTPVAFAATCNIGETEILENASWLGGLLIKTIGQYFEIWEHTKAGLLLSSTAVCQTPLKCQENAAQTQRSWKESLIDVVFLWFRNKSPQTLVFVILLPTCCGTAMCSGAYFLLSYIFTICRRGYWVSISPLPPKRSERSNF